MKRNHLNLFIFFLMTLLISLAVYLQYTISQSRDKLKDEEIKVSEQYAEGIAKYIQLKVKYADIKKTLTGNTKLQNELNEVLQAFLTKRYKYIFLLQKDKDHYRFLLDGSKEQAEEFNAIFLPSGNLFDVVYFTKRVQIIKQQDGVESIWLSLLYPIIREDKTEALLVLDLSEDYGHYIENFSSPLMSVAKMMQIFLLGSILLLLLATYWYYRFRKSILVDKLTFAHTKLYMEEFFNRNKVDDFNAIMIDIDEFSKVNKKYGHEVGDVVLAKFVKTIDSFTGEFGAKIIRIGGSEFFIIIPKSNTDLEAFAKKLFKILSEKKYLVSNEVLSLTVSMSAVDVPKDTYDIQNIQRMLDEKLLEVKSKGKDDLGILGIKYFNEVYYSSMDYIREALDEKRFLCLYQPIFNTKEKKIVKYEALVRLIDKDDRKKLISPFHFMRVIKGTSQYIKMSKLVLQEIFNTLEAYPNIELSMNLDLDDLYSKEVMSIISNKLFEHRKFANRLTFEIVEENEIHDYAKVASIFRQLKEYGSKIAIDDFGSGYANYGYLMQLNVDILKIDGSVVSKLLTSPKRAKAILSSIRDLASSLGYKLIAEYVADEEIYNMVKEIGIECSQGYYLGKPKLIEEYIH